MAINYSRVNWDTTKYVNPTNMNQMDKGIKDACDGVDNLGTEFDTVIGDTSVLPSPTHDICTNISEVNSNLTQIGETKTGFGQIASRTSNRIYAEMILQKISATKYNLHIQAKCDTMPSLNNDALFSVPAIKTALGITTGGISWDSSTVKIYDGDGIEHSHTMQGGYSGFKAALGNNYIGIARRYTVEGAIGPWALENLGVDFTKSGVVIEMTLYNVSFT